MGFTAREVVASAARTTTGTSAALVASGPSGPTTARRLSLLADVTAVSGTTPSLTLSVEWSHDGTAFAAADPADTFTAITAAGRAVKKFDVKGPHYRVVWTISGTTPSFTFAVSAYADTN